MKDDVPLVIGQGQFIPGFEEQLVGMAKGETRTIKETFPKNYMAEHLAGKDAVLGNLYHAAVHRGFDATLYDERVAIGNLNAFQLDVRTDDELASWRVVSRGHRCGL